MTRTQAWVLLFLVGLTVASYWWISERSTGLQRYHWFQAQLKQQKETNQELQRTNQRLRREMTALRYDHRLIEREARDLLTLTREGEIVVHLPR